MKPERDDLSTLIRRSLPLRDISAASTPFATPGWKVKKIKLPDDVLEVLVEAWSKGFTTKSDFARRHADPVGEAASRGLITTMSYTGAIFTRKWNITPKGCRKLFKWRKQ